MKHSLVRLFAMALASSVSGLLLALSYPPFGCSALAWVALVPLFLCLASSRPLGGFLLSLLAGLVYYSLAFQWTGAFHRYAIPVISLGSSLCFFAVPCLLMKPFTRRPALFLCAAPSIWVAAELVKQSWFLRFPFGIVGYTQYARLSLIQIADLGGVALVSWVILFVNACLFCAVSSAIFSLGGMKGRRHTLIAAGRYSALALGVLASAAVYGQVRLATLRYAEKSALKVGFAQTLFHPRKEWLSFQDEYLRKISGLGGRFAGLGVDLVLFPELTMDRALTLDPTIRVDRNAEILNGISALAKERGMNVLVGCLELRRNGAAVGTSNSMLQFSREGDLVGVYRKRFPVPFGEINPFGGAVPFLGKYLRSTTDSVELLPGKDAPLFSVVNGRGERVSFGVLICFEGTFGSPARDYARKGADFFVNATNDYWSLSTVAMYQHAVMSVFRAIETRTPVLRISNGGLSCYVDERGRYSSSIPVFSEGTMTSQLRLLEKKPLTLYVRLGDWFSILCAFGSFALVAFALRSRGWLSPLCVRDRSGKPGAPR